MLYYVIYMFLHPGGFLQPGCNNGFYSLLQLSHPYLLPLLQ